MLIKRLHAGDEIRIGDHTVRLTEIVSMGVGRVSLDDGDEVLELRWDCPVEVFPGVKLVPQRRGSSGGTLHLGIEAPRSVDIGWR